jgi:hypothetical protein
MPNRIASVLLTTITLTLAAHRAPAVNYTWAGGSNADWRDNTQWNPNTGYPGSALGDSANFPQFAPGSVTLRGAITLDTLTQQSFVPITISGNPTDGPASLTATTFTLNTGPLTLTSTGGPANATVSTSSPNFSNTGSITLQAGAGGLRTFDVLNILNDGQIAVSTDATVGRTTAGILQNGTGSVGLITITAGAKLTTHQYLQQGANTNTRIAGILDVILGPVQFTGGHLAGDGTLNDPVTLTSTSVEPRNAANLTTPGTLTLLDDVTFGNNARLDVVLGAAPGDASLLSVDGDFALTGAATTLALAGGTPNTTYVVATYTGTRTGTFSTSTSGYTVDYSTPGQIRVTVAPEPHTLALLAACTSPLLRRRRSNGVR